MNVILNLESKMDEIDYEEKNIINNSRSFLRELEKNETLILSKNTVAIILIIIVSIIFIIILWYNYSNDSVTNIPLIKADTSQIKIKPESPGGIIIPNTDKTIYQNLNSKKELPKIEKILPSPEEPIDRSKITQNKQKEIDQIDNEEEQKESVDKETIYHMVDEQDNSKFKDNYIKLLPKSQNRINTNHNKNNIASKYRVQLASFKTEKEVISEWSRIKNLNKDVIGNLELYIDNREITGKGNYYRLQIGPFKSDSDARLFCKKMKKLNQACIIAK